MNRPPLPRARPLAVVLAVVAGSALLPAVPAGASGGSTVRVSVTSDATQGAGLARLPAMASDGDTLVFLSDAALVPGALGDQLYTHRLSTGVTDLVTVSAAGGVSAGGLGEQHDIDADGSVVVFDSSATDLGPADDQTCSEVEWEDGEPHWEAVDCTDVFLRDRAGGGVTTKLSVGPSGQQADGHSVYPRVSDDGEKVVFLSQASNLVPGDTAGSWDVFLRDVPAGTTSRLTAGEGDVGSPAISADGTTVAFRRGADIVVHDLGTGLAETLPLGVTTATRQDYPTLSGDGDLVAFHTNAQLLPGDQNSGYDAYLYDRDTGVRTLLSANGAGTQVTYADGAEVSDDGRSALFQGAGGLVPGTSPSKNYLYVRDLASGVLRIANVSSAGVESSTGWDPDWRRFSALRSLSADGSRVAFSTLAANLVVGDTNGAEDVFVHTFPPSVPPGNVVTALDGSGTVVSSGTDATADVPVVLAITPPAEITGDLTVALSPADATAPPAGYAFFGRQLAISAPPASVTAPYVVAFTVDDSLRGAVAPADVQVFRDGLAVADCTDPTGAVPDPCVVSRAGELDGDAVVIVRTSRFSVWKLGRLAYEVSGPLAPVEAQPTVNVVKAGSAVPVTFGLGGDRGPDVFADGYPRTTTADCSGTPDVVQETSSPGGAALAYDDVSGTYTYVWKTSRDESGCRDLVVRFRDGSRLPVARFQLR